MNSIEGKVAKLVGKVIKKQMIEYKAVRCLMGTNGQWIGYKGKFIIKNTKDKHKIKNRYIRLTAAKKNEIKYSKTTIIRYIPVNPFNGRSTS